MKSTLDDIYASIPINPDIDKISLRGNFINVPNSFLYKKYDKDTIIFIGKGTIIEPSTTVDKLPGGMPTNNNNLLQNDCMDIMLLNGINLKICKK